MTTKEANSADAVSLDWPRTRGVWVQAAGAGHGVGLFVVDGREVVQPGVAPDGVVERLDPLEDRARQVLASAPASAVQVTANDVLIGRYDAPSKPCRLPPLANGAESETPFLRPSKKGLWRL